MSDENWKKGSLASAAQRFGGPDRRRISRTLRNRYGVIASGLYEGKRKNPVYHRKSSFTHCIVALRRLAVTGNNFSNSFNRVPVEMEVTIAKYPFLRHNLALTDKLIAEAANA